MLNIEEKKQLHYDFWNRDPMSEPLVSFRVGNMFYGQLYKAAQPFLTRGKKVTADMIDVDSFIPDYERMYDESQTITQTAFWAAEPFIIIPWMEAFFGCSVYATEDTFVTKPIAKSPDEIIDIQIDPDNPWVQLYFEFLNKLGRLSKGRFPIAQPVMRGPTDILGALLGQEDMIIALFEHRDSVIKIVEQIAESFCFVINEHGNRVTPFLDGYSIGNYHVWAPGKVIWYQDDLSAVLSPDLYSNFFIGAGKRICSDYHYTAFHLHPAAFFIVDDLLTITNLKVIEVNKDEGMTLEEMLPVLKKIIRKKNLILWGKYNSAELKLIKQELGSVGLAFNILVDSVEEALVDRFVRLEYRNYRVTVKKIFLEES